MNKNCCKISLFFATSCYYCNKVTIGDSIPNELIWIYQLRKTALNLDLARMNKTGELFCDKPGSNPCELKIPRFNNTGAKKSEDTPFSLDKMSYETNPHRSDFMTFFNSMYEKFMKGEEISLPSIVSASSTGNVECPSVKVLKAAPGADRNNNQNYSNQEMPISPEPSSHDSEIKRKKSACKMSRVSECINQLTDIFVAKMDKIENDQELSVPQRLQKQNTLFKHWMENIYEQYTVSVSAFEEMEDIVVSVRKEYKTKLNDLRRRMSRLYSENRFFKNSFGSIGSNGNQDSFTKFMKNISEEMDELKASHAAKSTSLEQCETDLKVLMGLIIRLRHGGIWDCKGMRGKLSLDVYNKLFKDDEEFSGKRLQYIDDLEQAKTKISEDVRCLKQKREQVRSHLLRKHSDLEKVVREEQRTLKVLADAKAEKSRLLKEIEELRQTRSSLETAGSPATCDDFVKM